MKVRLISLAMLFILFWNRDNNAEAKAIAKSRVVTALDLGERTVPLNGTINIANSDSTSAPFEILDGALVYSTPADYIVLSRDLIIAAMGPGELDICLLAGAVTLLADEINISTGSDVKFAMKDGLKTTIFVLNTTYAA